VLDLRFNEIVNGEVFRDSKGVEPVGSDASIEVGGVGKPREGLGFGTGLEAGGGTAIRRRSEGSSTAGKGCDDNRKILRETSSNELV
jgi:hypothetical protein